MIDNASANDANLAAAGAIGTTFSPTVSPNLSAAKGVAITDAITAIGATAVTAAQTGGSSQGTQDAVNALTQGLSTLAETAAAQGGPIAQVAANVLAPSVAAALAQGIILIANKIGVTVHNDLYKIAAWFEKL